MKILLIGYARHGKDEAAKVLNEVYGISYRGSSEMAAEIFLYDLLKDKYAYKTPEECFEDRVNHRVEWKEEICKYNTPDKARLARNIIEKVDMYVGMRDAEEISACREQGLFDLVIGVYRPGYPREDKSSCPIDVFEESDLVIPNVGSLKEFRDRVVKVMDDYVKIDTMKKFMGIQW